VTKIYTGTGDAGRTSTFGGPRVPKSHPRVQAYGSVDELNCVLGIARTLADDEIAEAILALQRRLFTLGADLATPPDSPSADHASRVPVSWISDLEVSIDRYQTELPPLNNFILPGGSPAAAALHLSRAVCRRAERACVAATIDGEDINPEAITFLNRLSDWLFVVARVANQRGGIPDEEWAGP